jgi:hypothetical protein
VPGDKSKKKKEKGTGGEKDKMVAKDNTAILCLAANEKTGAEKYKGTRHEVPATDTDTTAVPTRDHLLPPVRADDLDDVLAENDVDSGTHGPADPMPGPIEVAMSHDDAGLSPTVWPRHSH